MYFFSKPDAVRHALGQFADVIDPQALLECARVAKRALPGIELVANYYSPSSGHITSVNGNRRWTFDMDQRPAFMDAVNELAREFGTDDLKVKLGLGSPRKSRPVQQANNQQKPTAA